MRTGIVMMNNDATFRWFFLISSMTSGKYFEANYSVLTVLRTSKAMLSTYRNKRIFSWGCLANLQRWLDYDHLGTSKQLIVAQFPARTSFISCYVLCGFCISSAELLEHFLKRVRFRRRSNYVESIGNRFFPQLNIYAK